ncbi:MAG: hypothetical protein QNJ40_16325 [Xanthomonadales bacterium]|nr:hypothetical protein [Xanthomonadales bacterium]
MYNLKRLAGVAYQGLADLWPSIRQAYNADPDDDSMDRVYGPNPRITVPLIGVGCVVVGEWFARWGPGLPFKEFVNWSAVLTGVMFALLIRRYLFAGQKARPDDFGWLAASVAPALALVILVAPLANIFFGSIQPRPMIEPGVQLGTVLVMLTDALGLAAAMVISLATLCFSRNWPSALIDLAVRLFVFKLMVWITALVLLEIDIVSTLAGAIVESITGWRVPEWLSELADQLSYAAILATAYLAVIGGTWMVCKQSFAELLAKGEVDILKALERLVEDPKKRKKKEKKKKGKTEPAA